MKRILSLILPLSLLVMPLLQGRAFAASATLYLTPSSSSVVKGSTLTINVYENSGTEPVNAVQANFSYSAASLQYVSINNSSAFGVVAQNQQSSGSISIARGAQPSVTGAQLVASVTFTALASSGSAAFAFTSGSSVVSANTNTDITSGSTGTNVTFTAPQPSPSPSPSPSPTSKPTPTPTPSSSSHNPSSSSTSTTPVKDTTPPTISGITVTGIATNAATINWTTSEAANAEVDYGVSKSYGLSSLDGTMATMHTIALNSSLLSPGTMYHFVVISADASGNKATSADMTFTTQGTSLVVTVLDLHSKPISGAKVSFNGQTASTDSNGKATLTSMPLGKSTITITVNGKTTAETVQLDRQSSNFAPQKVFFKVSAPAKTSIWVIAGAGILLVVFAGVIFGGIRLKKRTGGNAPWNKPSNDMTGGIPTVTTMGPTAPNGPNDNSLNMSPIYPNQLTNSDTVPSVSESPTMLFQPRNRQ